MFSAISRRASPAAGSPRSGRRPPAPAGYRGLGAGRAGVASPSGRAWARPRAASQARAAGSGSGSAGGPRPPRARARPGGLGELVRAVVAARRARPAGPPRRSRAPPVRPRPRVCGSAPLRRRPGCDGMPPGQAPRARPRRPRRPPPPAHPVGARTLGLGPQRAPPRRPPPRRRSATASGSRPSFTRGKSPRSIDSRLGSTRGRSVAVSPGYFLTRKAPRMKGWIRQKYV